MGFRMQLVALCKIMPLVTAVNQPLGIDHG